MASSSECGEGSATCELWVVLYTQRSKRRAGLGSGVTELYPPGRQCPHGSLRISPTCQSVQNSAEGHAHPSSGYALTLRALAAVVVLRSGSLRQHAESVHVISLNECRSQHAHPFPWCPCSTEEKGMHQCHRSSETMGTLTHHQTHHCFECRVRENRK